MTKNKLADLNDHLFAQLERLADEELTPEQIDQESKRGAAIIGIADQIIKNAGLQIQAAKLLSEHGYDPSPHLPAVEGGNKPRQPLPLVQGKKTQ
jgi:hypothetical protein